MADLSDRTVRAGVHPAPDEGGGGASSGPHHQISLMCDNIEATVAELAAKGAEFSRGVRDDGFGLTTMLKVPGAGDLMLYQARHPEVHSF